MNEILADMFRHNLWANQQLLDTCAGLDEVQLNATDPGTYGTVAMTLTHLAGAEQRYVQYLTNLAPDMPVREDASFPGFDALRQALQQSGERLIELARNEEPGRVARTTRRGEPFAIRSELLLIQAINHATEHRTNITTILAQQHIPTPEIDGWSFQDEL